MARGDYPSTKQDQYMLRFPDGMRERIKAIADQSGRSMNAEIVARLEDSFAPESSAELRRQLIVMDRYVQALERSHKASNASTDATKTVADMYEQQVKELQDRLDQVASVSMFVATAIKDATEGAGWDLKILQESLHPFQAQPQDAQADRIRELLSVDAGRVKPLVAALEAGNIDEAIRLLGVQDDDRVSEVEPIK